MTRGERRAAGNGLFHPEDNLESPWARRALQVLFRDLEFSESPPMRRVAFEAKTGLKLTYMDGNLLATDETCRR